MRLLRILLAAFIVFAPVVVRAQNVAPGIGAVAGSEVRPGFSGDVSCAQANIFLARATGLNLTHINAYKQLICGLVTDGLWSLFDVLYIFATQNSTVAGLNLVSTSFTITAAGSPVFTVDRGYTGVDASSTVYLDTGYTPSSGVQLTQNLAHVSAWCNTDVAATASGGALIGSLTAGAREISIFPRYSDGNAFFPVNVAGATTGAAKATSVGHYIANRTLSNAWQGYVDGVAFTSGVNASGLPSTSTVSILARNLVTTRSLGSACTVSMASIGNSLNAGQAAAFHNRLRTYMNVVGVP